MRDIAILGGGAFGTALAIALGQDRAVTLWARDPDQVNDMSKRRQNHRHLPDCHFPNGVTPTSELGNVTENTVLLALPTQQLGAFLARHGPQFTGRTLVLCCKGVDRETGLRPSELVSRSVNDVAVAVLTGPSFAVDIARGLPTALSLATREEGEALQSRLSCPTLRLYLTDDVVGAELGGALKNVIALAAGLTIGAGLADSARAAVITRGFAEISRYAIAQGARPETLAGLSGLGDLILTCTSEKSRNFRAGIAFAKGEGLPKGQTIEGLATAHTVASASESIAGADMPLTCMVAAVTEGRLTVADAAAALMARPLKKE
jgi:glycerol-3-phosphate dehydrogenase (NAD(P)+)